MVTGGPLPAGDCVRCRAFARGCGPAAAVRGRLVPAGDCVRFRAFEWGCGSAAAVPDGLFPVGDCVGRRCASGGWGPRAHSACAHMRPTRTPASGGLGRPPALSFQPPSSQRGGRRLRVSGREALTLHFLAMSPCIHIQRTERIDCAIAGRMDTLCKDRAGKTHVADLSANQGPPSQAGTVPFQVYEDRIGGSAISPSQIRLVSIAFL